ncbi:MAG TPA: ATP-binding protein [Bryobacteraceae bacterium]|nr:ATP-binding protein [Bryobacteraceae bacterium]
MLLDSTLDSVEVAERAVLQAAEDIGFGEDELHQLGMAVREGMVNAVVHGNAYNARKKVHVSITKAADRLTVVIADEGKGFDVSSVPDPLEDNNLLRQSGRGLLLMRAFVDEFQVRRAEPSGTEVTMVKYLAKAS